FQFRQVGFEVPFIILKAHLVHATGCVLPQAVETQAQDVLVEPPIQVAEPMVFISMCLLGYGPQEGLPVLFRRSYGSGCLCGLRCSVGPFTRFGAHALLRATMNQSDSRFTRPRFLSLRFPSCLALV